LSAKQTLNAKIRKSFSNLELSMLSFYSSSLALFVIHFLAQSVNVIISYKAFFLFYKMTSCDVTMPSSDFMLPGCNRHQPLNLWTDACKI